jgi:4a-hydroxytetrahydrobiopterin dehydratase
MSTGPTPASPPAASVKLMALAAMHCRPGAPRLSDEELREHLGTLTGWTFADNRIEKAFKFATYHDTMAFANAVAWIAHRDDHHPDLVVRYGSCRVLWSTHDAGGVTLNDCICAAKVERLTA